LFLSISTTGGQRSFAALTPWKFAAGVSLVLRYHLAANFYMFFLSAVLQQERRKLSGVSAA
jgi:hypothetical protein